MYLLHVIPISRGIAKEQLSYVSKTTVTPGAVVSVPLRRRQVPALVIDVQPATNAKASIKSADFALKQIKNPKPAAVFTPAAMRAAAAIAREHAATTGAVLHAIAPTALLAEPVSLPTPPADEAHADSSTPTAEKLLLQSGEMQRVETYRNLIRESFARNSSVFILVPTTPDAENLAARLEKGIAEYVYTLHGALTKKRQRERWAAALDTSHPVAIIGTASFATIPRRDIDTYVIEREQSRFYKMRNRPFLDIRIAIERIAEAAYAKCVFADFPVRTETYYRLDTHELDELGTPVRRSTGVQHITIANPAGREQYSEAEADDRPFRILSTELAGALRTAREEGRRTFLYTARRGIASTVVCNDCGTHVACHSCSAGVALHGGRGSRHNTFVCHACGTSRSAHECCAYCGSWNLKELGIGTERISAAAAGVLGDRDGMFELDADTAKTHAQARKTATAFLDTPGGVLIGTDRAIPYLPADLGVAAIVSADAILSLPDFRGAERLVATAVQLSDRAETTIVQTRAPDTDLYEYLRTGRLIDFYRAELSVRETLSLPPYAVLIAVRHAAKSTRARNAVRDLLPAVPETCTTQQYELPPRSGRREKLAMILIRVPRSVWPAAALLERLRTLPPECSVDVHAESLF